MMTNSKTAGESLLDVMNTETFLQLLGQEAPDHILEMFKLDRPTYELASGVFLALPHLSNGAKFELKTEIRKLQKGQINEPTRSK